jgi:hypothetical protein
MMGWLPWLPLKDLRPQQTASRADRATINLEFAVREPPFGRFQFF